MRIPILERTAAHRKARALRRFDLQVGQLEQRALLSDTTPPTTVVASEVGKPGMNGWFVSPVTVNFSATDPDNTPAELTTFFSVNGGATQTGSSLTLSHDGIFMVAYHSVDPAGNVEATHTLIVMIDQTAPTITVHASPNILWPPNHKLVAVTVTGRVTDATSGPAGTVHFKVVDEYDQVEPHGTVSLDSTGHYSFVVMLPASRTGQDKDGRTFTIFVAAADKAGNIGMNATVVLVPHDMGHPFNFSQGGNDQGQNQGGNGNGNGKGKGHKGGGSSVAEVLMPVVLNTGSGSDNGNGGGNGHGHGNGNGNGNGHGHGHGG